MRECCVLCKRHGKLPCLLFNTVNNCKQAIPNLSPGFCGFGASFRFSRFAECVFDDLSSLFDITALLCCREKPSKELHRYISPTQRVLFRTITWMLLSLICIERFPFLIGTCAPVGI